MTTAFNYTMFYARSEVIDAIIHFGKNDLNTADQNTYYLNLLRENLPITGTPILFTRPISGKSKRLTGAIALVALWNDEESSVYTYPALAGEAIKWFDNFQKEQSDIVCPHPPEAQQVVTHQRPNDGPDEGTQSLECTACGKVLS